MEVDLSWNGSVLVARPRGRWLDAQTSPFLHDALAAEFGNGARHVVVDMADVENMDSAGIGTVVRLLRLVPEGGRLVLSACRTPVRQLLEKARVDQILVCFEVTPEAVEAIKAG